jgi:hypothetical protein
MEYKLKKDIFHPNYKLLAGRIEDEEWWAENLDFLDDIDEYTDWFEKVKPLVKQFDRIDMFDFIDFCLPNLPKEYFDDRFDRWMLSHFIPNNDTQR